MSKKHTDALKAKIREIAPLVSKVFVTVADRTVTEPYVVIHPASGANTQDRVSAPRSTKHPRFTLHVVGSSGEQAQHFADQLEELLFPAGRGIRIDVVGEKGRPLWFEQPLPIQALTDPQPTVIFAVIELGWQSDPI